MGKAKTAETTQSREAAPGACLLKPLHIETSQGKLSLSPWVLLAANLLFTFLVFSVYRRLHFDGDAYWHIQQPERLVPVCLEGGRPLMALIYWVALLLGRQPGLDSTLGWAALTIVYAVSATVYSLHISRTLSELSWERVLVIDAAALLVFVNVYCCEWFYYATSFSLAIGFALMMASVIVIACKPTPWGAVLSGLCLLGAACIYQVFIETFLVLALPLVFLSNGRQTNKRLIRRTLCILSVALAAAVATLLIPELIVDQSASAGYQIDAATRHATLNLTQLIKNVKMLWVGQTYWMRESFNLLPKYSLLTVLLSAQLILIFGILRSYGKKSLLPTLLYLAAVLLCCYLVQWAPHLISGLPSVVARTQMAVFAFVSVSILLAVCVVQSKLLQRILLVLTLGFLVYNAYICQQLACNTMVVNALDKYEIRQVDQAIEDYEQESGQKVTRIAFLINEEATPYKGFIPKSQYETFRRVLSMPYADTQAINFHTGRELIEGSVPEDVHTYFAGKHWEELNVEEQLLFIGETLYMAVY